MRLFKLLRRFLTMNPSRVGGRHSGAYHGGIKATGEVMGKLPTGTVTFVFTDIEG